MSNPAPPIAPLALSLLEASRAMRISERHLQQLALDGEIPSVKIGRRRVFPADLLAEFLRRRATGGNVGGAGGAADATGCPGIDAGESGGPSGGAA
jgi:excisionase family DNA binding protein